MDEGEYDSSYSEDNFSTEDKLLVENAKNSVGRREISSDEEVYRFGLSDSDEKDGEEDEEEEFNENHQDISMGSDLEDEKKFPDDRAWGKRKKNFYSTDYVDQDYEGIYQGEEAETAELEEKEARNIQKRLIEQLHDADFSIMETVDIAEAAEPTANQEVILSDLTKLSKRQKLDLVKKESPEFFMLVEDFKVKIKEVQKFFPIINYFKKKTRQSFPALDFLQTKLMIILNYCTNISYYLFLKAKRISVKNHPVLRSLFQYRQLLEQLEEVNEKIIEPQVNKMLKTLESGKEISLDENLLEKKKVLKVLLKQKHRQGEDVAQNSEKEIKMEEMGIGDDEIKDEHIPQSTDKKRAITYEMAKNKGLIPKRSKEQRNPRVKHRRKYEKAKIRRRGQVRTPRTEIPIYGGEPTGIKIGVTKSIKIKY